MAETRTTPIFIDGFSSFELGINSGVAPLLLPRNQLSFAINATVRGTYVTHRPAYRKITLEFENDAELQAAVENAKWQGGCYYKPDSGSEALVAAIGGKLFRFDVDPTIATVTDISPPAIPTVVTTFQFTVPAVGADVTVLISRPYTQELGELMTIAGGDYTVLQTFNFGTTVRLRNVTGVPAAVIPAATAVTWDSPSRVDPDLAWLWQAEQFVIWADGVHYPVFYDGVTSRESLGYSTIQFVGRTTAPFNVPVVAGTVVIVLDQDNVGLVNGDQLNLGIVGTFVVTNVAGLSITIATVATSSPGALVTTGWQVNQSGDPELPACRMGAYGMGRNWISLTDGRSFMASDIVGSTSGSSAYNNRDSVLKITENTFLSGGGNFVVPGNVGDIRAMVFTATLDASLGQGPLQVFTPNVVFSCNAPVDRSVWQDITNPILTESLISNGGLGQNSTIQANNDTIFRSIDGIRSLILARREFNTWGNTPISREVQRVIDRDSTALMGFSSAVNFNNRMLMTSKPTPNDQGVYNPGTIALNFDPLSSMSGKAPSVYDGLWTGINVLQWIRGRFNGVDRAFAFTLNTVENKIELYELLQDGSAIADNNGAETPIVWQIETGCLFKNVKGKDLYDNVKLIDGEIYIADVAGRVGFEVAYRNQFDPCWHDWTAFSVCATARDITDPSQDNIRKQNYVRLGFGQPPVDACDPVNNRPYRVGETFQVRIRVTGSCKIYGIKSKAALDPEVFFAKVACGNADCKTIECVADDDYEIYTLEDQFVPVPPAPESNRVVSRTFSCGEEESIAFTGTLPGWITLDLDTGVFTGAAGTFTDDTQEDATAIAQAQLNTFVETAIVSGDLTCEEPPPPQPEIVLVPAETTGWGVEDCIQIIEVAGVLYGVGNTNVYTSTDGVNWSVVAAHGISFLIVGISFGNGVFVIATQSSNRSFTSPDAITWTLHVIAFTPQTIAFGAGLFVISASGGSTARSSDGITWTLQAISSGTLRCVIYAGGQFIIVGQNEQIWSSPDGIVWTNRLPVGSGNLWSVEYSDGIYVASGNGGTTYTSPDGEVWTFQATGIGADLRACGGGNGLHLVITNAGDVYTSPDAITWTFLRAEPSGNFPTAAGCFYYSTANVLDVGFFV